MRWKRSMLYALIQRKQRPFNSSANRTKSDRAFSKTPQQIPLANASVRKSSAASYGNISFLFCSRNVHVCINKFQSKQKRAACQCAAHTFRKLRKKTCCLFISLSSAEKGVFILSIVHKIDICRLTCSDPDILSKIISLFLSTASLSPV